WFLIQARDLGRERKIEEDLPEIEYMLAFSKYVQQNYSVAQAEFEKAKQLAGDEDNRVLQLAISDKLGDIYLWLENYQGAEEELQEYWRLRNELFENTGVVN
ncbi:MAG: tetratricopeptide repeat protein, partial [Sphingobacteriaceae bacterium]